MRSGGSWVTCVINRLASWEELSAEGVLPPRATDDPTLVAASTEVAIVSILGDQPASWIGTAGCFELEIPDDPSKIEAWLDA